MALFNVHDLPNMGGYTEIRFKQGITGIVFENGIPRVDIANKDYETWFHNYSFLGFTTLESGDELIVFEHDKWAWFYSVDDIEHIVEK